MVFGDFFYLLREKKVPVSLNEWMVLMEALKNGMAYSNLIEFYYTSRSILVKTEADFDKFDLAFLEYFDGAYEHKGFSDELLEYLENPIEQLSYDENERNKRPKLEFEALKQLLEQRLKEQEGAHNGGSYWIGTGGNSPFGNTGYHETGVSIEGKGKSKSALQRISARAYRDFREDETIGIRQFQVALRRLRQLSGQSNEQQEEFNLEETIEKTARNGGNLKIIYKRPRVNAVKLMLLFDSGGSMEPYAKLCSQLFQAVSKENHFKDLKIYYFHNCPYNRIYKTPECVFQESVDTKWILNNIKSDYKVIMVGDVSMALWEMRYYTGGRQGKVTDQISGVRWLHEFVQKYKKIIWFNPIPKQQWEFVRGKETIKRIQEEIPMYQLSIEGLEEGIKHLIAAR